MASNSGKLVKGGEFVFHLRVEWKLQSDVFTRDEETGLAEGDRVLEK